MSRKVIIVGHVDHAHCSSIAAGLGIERGVLYVDSREFRENPESTESAASFPVKNFDMEPPINPTFVKRYKESKRKGHERPYKYHR